MSGVTTECLAQVFYIHCMGKVTEVIHYLQGGNPTTAKVQSNSDKENMSCAGTKLPGR